MEHQTLKTYYVKVEKQITDYEAMEHQTLKTYYVKVEKQITDYEAIEAFDIYEAHKKALQIEGVIYVYKITEESK
jgi:hypothetical protein